MQKRGQYPAILTKQTWSIMHLLLWPKITTANQTMDLLRLACPQIDNATNEKLNQNYYCRLHLSMST